MDPFIVILAPVIALFYALVGLGPFLGVFVIDRPSIGIGVVTGLFGLGVIVHILYDGTYARIAAKESNALDGGSRAGDLAWGHVIRAFLALIWLVPVTGLFAASMENRGAAMVAGTSFDYSVLAIWHLAGIVPLLNLQEALASFSPGIESWGPATGTALIMDSLVLAYSVLLVITELVVRRSRQPEAVFYREDQSQTRSARRQAILLSTLFWPVRSVGSLSSPASPGSRNTHGMALVGMLMAVSILGLVYSVVRGHWIGVGLATYWWIGARLLQLQYRRRGADV